MSRGASSLLSQFLKKSKEESAFIRHYVWKYRTYVGVGLVTLIVLDVSEIFPPFLMKRAVDVATERLPLIQLRQAAIAYLIIALIQAVCRWGWRMYLIRASFLAGRDLRAAYSHKLFSLGQSFFDKAKIGEMMSLATNDVEAVRIAIGPGLLVLFDALFCFVTIPPAMYYLSPKLTLLSFVTLPLIPFLVYRNEKEVHERFEKVQEQFSEVSALAQEGLTGIRVVKAFAKEDTQVHRLRAAGQEYLRLSMRLARVQTSFGPILDYIVSVGLVILLYFGGKWVMLGSSPGVGATVLTLGTFIAFQRYIQKMVWPMAAVGLAVSYYQRSVSSGKRLQETLSLSTDVPEAAEPKLPPGYIPGGVWRTRGAVELRNLSFSFPTHSEVVLNSISLSIEPGERIAVVGAIGAGKSALLSLLPRLYPVSRGMLFVDGIDVNDWPLEELRRQVGYVSQDVFLFSENVTENIALGIKYTTIAEIERATQLAAVHEDILNLVRGYGTRLGERGVNLSGGQKQRLTIARALAKEPSILVLDDALSSVDVQTEEKILQGLRSRPGRNTELISAHRISTVRDADRIIVIQNSRIAQQGTHRQLVRETGGAYSHFYEQQLLKEELESYSEAMEVNP